VPHRKAHFLRPLSSLALATLLGFSAISSAQVLPKVHPKEEERTTYHPGKVKGTPASVVLESYARRLQMEADSFFGGIEWRNVGPENQGGRVLSIKHANVKVNGATRSRIFCAFATGGLHISDDDGATWTSIFDNQSAFGIGDVDVSKDGQTIWIGTGEANSQRTSYAGTGVFKSTDGGATWTNVGLPESHHIGRIRVDPKNPNVVWVAVLGHLYSQNDERGVYKTSDGGKSWQQVLKVDDFTGAIDLVIDPRNSNNVVASMWDRDRRAWNFRESGVGSAVYRTADGGKKWSKVDTLPSGNDAGRIGLAQSESNPNIVYAFVDHQGPDKEWLDFDEKVPSGRLTPRRFFILTEETFVEVDRKALERFWRDYAPEKTKLDDVIEQVKAKKMTMIDVRNEIMKRSPGVFEPDIVEHEFYRSEDGGKTFTRVSRMGNHGGYYWGKVFVDPRNPNHIYTHGVSALRSKDGGKSWERTAAGVHADFHSMLFDPADPQKIWIGCDGGIYRTNNDGKTWTHLNTISVGQTTTLAVRNESAPYTIITGLQDNGTMMGKSNYTPGRSPLDAWVDLGGGDGSHVAIDPRPDLGLIYGASQFGAHYAFEEKTGVRYRAAASARRGEEPLRYNWISPLIVSSHIPDIIYLGSQYVHRSFDRGRTWQKISPDLTRNKKQGDVPHSTIKDLSESPLRFGLIYAGSDDGRVTMTHDGGYKWENIDTPAPDKWVCRVIASRHNESTLYVAQTGYREDDFAPYLWKSTDYGKTYTSIVGNLPFESINVVREDPKNPNILYVGTDLGVFITFDGGKNWETLHGKLGHLPVHDLVIQEKENDLVIATHAKGIYILPLNDVHSLDAKLRTTDLSILKLGTLERSENWGYDRKAPWDKSASNDFSAPLSFFTNSAGKAKIEVKDKDGNVVKTMEMDAVKGFNYTRVGTLIATGDKFAPKKTATDAKTALDDPFIDRREKYLPSGKYTVVITKDGKSVTKEWTL